MKRRLRKSSRSLVFSRPKPGAKSLKCHVEYKLSIGDIDIALRVSTDGNQHPEDIAHYLSLGLKMAKSLSAECNKEPPLLCVAQAKHSMGDSSNVLAIVDLDDPYGE